jgi:Flp pilus assembly protein TadD
MCIGHEVELPASFPSIATALGTADTLGGRLADAVPRLTPAMDQSRAMARRASQAPSALSLGEAQRLAGHLEEAYALAERTRTLTRAPQERGHEAYALRLLGEIATCRAPLASEGAASDYRQPRALAGALGMRPLQAHCHRGLGTLYDATGQQEQARVELSTAIESTRRWR